MKKLTFKVDGQYITRTDHEKPVAKCRHLYRAEFEFTGDEWTGTKTALFANGNKAKSQVLDEKNSCEVPWEFFDTDTGTIGLVSVFCGDLTTANSASVYIAKSGYVESDASVPPTPDVYQQLIDTANETKEIAQSVRDDADVGKFRGEQGPMGPTGPKGEKGERGETGPQGSIGQTGPQGAKGEKGDTGAQGPKGDTGPQGEIGKTGESAYQTAVKLGFKGTEQEWIESLKYDHSEEFANLAEEVKNTANGIVADRQQIQKNAVDIESLGHNKADAIVSSASGEQIVLTDSDNESLKGLHVYGKSTQVTTTGAQLLNPKSFGADINVEGCTIRSNGDGSIFISKAKTASSVTYELGDMTDKLVNKKAYTAGNSNINGKNVIIQFVIRRDTETLYASTFTYSDSLDKSVFARIVLTANDVCEGTISPMVNEGTSAKPYQPYTGGKPSPSIEYPQEIVSAGDKGDIGVKVTGKNVLPFPYKMFLEEKTLSGVTFTPLEDGGIKINGTSTNVSCLNLDMFRSDENMICVLWNKDGTEYKLGEQSLFFNHDINNNLVFISVPKAGLTYNNLVVYPTMQLKVIPKSYEPYKEPQSLTLQTPNGLPGIKVDKDGNYTDAKGQQWICDEIDLARGKYIQHIGIINAKNEKWADYWNKVFPDETGKTICFNSVSIEHGIYGLSNRFVIGDIRKTEENKFNMFEGNGAIGIRVSKSSFPTINEWNEYIKNNDVIFYITFRKSIERDLTPEEIAAYKALHTNYSTTTIVNDENAGMKVKYVADTKNYIDKKFAELNQAIVNTQIALL